MYSTCFKSWSDYTTKSLAQWKALSETGFGIAGSLLNAQIELAAALTDIAAYHAGSISQAKDAGEAASRHFGLAEESGKVLIETAHSTAEILADAGKAYSKIIETSLASGAAFAKTSNTSHASKAQKQAA